MAEVKFTAPPAACIKMNINTRMLLLGGVTAGLFALGGGRAQAIPPGYTPIWSEDFNQPVGSAPDPARWKFNLGNNDGWGNHELETYVDDREHARIVADPACADGRALQIQVTSDGAGQYRSARIDTAARVAFRYGYIEARIKVPAGKGLWPAFWMLGDDLGRVGWPGCGEIDIMEHLGREPSVVHGSFHGPSDKGDCYLTSTATLPNAKRFADGYHLFALQWSPDSATCLVDGVPYETRRPADLRPGAQWVFNHPFFFILNLAVGGGDAGAPDADTVFPQAMRVDYIRIYQRSAPPVGRTVRLKSLANYQYLSLTPGGALVAAGGNDGERFAVVDEGKTKVALRCLSTGGYVGVGADGTVTAGGATVGPAQTFQWVDTGDGAATLWSLSAHKYVGAPDAGKKPLVAERSAADDWETFVVTPE